MSKHTPGPWKVSYHPDGCDCEAVNRRVRVSIPTFGSHIQSAVYFSKHSECQDEHDEANARLIAAAPEMLAALKAIHHCLFLHSEYPAICKDIDAAIAKAEGRSS